ncbi:MAG: winged helix-turn-helix domain-containing protein [Bacillota bacterium]
MKCIKMTKRQARHFLLECQGLLPPRSLRGKEGIMEYIRQVGSIQFDPLNIAGRNPELVLQSRVEDFRPGMLEELLYEDRRLLDGWDKMMCIYPLEDWPFFKRYRDECYNRYYKEGNKITSVLSEVRKLITEKGPLSSIELPYDEKISWPWGKTTLSRAVLESMYYWGELVIHHKVNTRRVYDFACKHIPEEIFYSSDPNLTAEQYVDWHVLRRLGSVGLLWGKAGDAWIGMKDVKSKERTEALARLLAENIVVEIHLEGIKQPVYARKADIDRIGIPEDTGLTDDKACIIAPLDNLLWDRKFINELFGFDYRWEVYKPVEQRDYGYYVLPVLYGDSFVARFEPGREKDTGALIIKNWWWEPNVEQTDKMREELRLCFKKFMDFLGVKKLVIDAKIRKKADVSWLSNPKKP